MVHLVTRLGQQGLFALLDLQRPAFQGLPLKRQTSNSSKLRLNHGTFQG